MFIDLLWIGIPTDLQQMHACPFQFKGHGCYVEGETHRTTMDQHHHTNARQPTHATAVGMRVELAPNASTAAQCWGVRCLLPCFWWGLLWPACFFLLGHPPLFIRNWLLVWVQHHFAMSQYPKETTTTNQPWSNISHRTWKQVNSIHLEMIKQFQYPNDQSIQEISNGTHLMDP